MISRDNGHEPLMYPVRLALQYKVYSRNRELVSVGRGRTTLIGSHEMVFTSEAIVPDGDLMEVAVTWPVLLDRRVKLQLFVRGQAVGVDGKRITVRIEKYEFRTNGVSTQVAPLPLPEISREAPRPLAMHA